MGNFAKVSGRLKPDLALQTALVLVIIYVHISSESMMMNALNKTLLSISVALELSACASVKTAKQVEIDAGDEAVFEFGIGEAVPLSVEAQERRERMKKQFAD